MSRIASALIILLGLYLPALAQGDLLLFGVGAAPAFNPLSIAGLALWYDPRDSTTVFTNSGCTTPAVTTNTVLCIKDKSGHGCNMTGTTGPTLTVSGAIAFLTFNGTTQFLSSSCTSVVQNVPRAIGFSAGNATLSANSGPLFYAGTNSSGTARFTSMYSYAGTGFGVRARELDTDAGVSAQTGTTTTSVTEMRNDVEYINATNNIILFINGVSNSIAQTATVGSNTSNTASTAVLLGADDSGTTAFYGGTIYQFLLYTPASALSAGTMSTIDTFTCARAGLVC